MTVRSPLPRRFVGATLVMLSAVAATAGCGADSRQVADELARIRASASASALAAEQERIVVEAEEAAQAAATSRSATSVPTTAPSEQAVDPDLLDPAVSPGARGSVAGLSSRTVGVPGGTRPDAGGDAHSSFAALEARVGPVGVSLVPSGGGTVTSYGSVTTGVAWSTIKVPLSVAAVRADGGRPSAATAASIQRAITVSDNAAAERLWARLGGGARGAAAVGAVLADGGDPATRVPTRRLRPGFTVFGQTPWPLERAATYAAHLPCQRGAGPVLAQMGRVAAGQRWGLGTLGSLVRFKGGWGPDSGGRYLVRQLGVVTLPGGGQVGVAIASRPASGSFRDGTAALTAVTRWLSSRVGSLTGGRC